MLHGAGTGTSGRRAGARALPHIVTRQWSNQFWVSAGLCFPTSTTNQHAKSTVSVLLVLGIHSLPLMSTMLAHSRFSNAAGKKEASAVVIIYSCIEESVLELCESVGRSEYELEFGW